MTSRYAQARHIFFAIFALGAGCLAAMPSRAEAAGAPEPEDDASTNPALEWNACCYRSGGDGLTCRPKGTNETTSCIGESYPLKANCNATSTTCKAL
jgi:hypothetical protein